MSREILQLYEANRLLAERTLELQVSAARWLKSETTIKTLFRISKSLNATLDVDTILDTLTQEAIRFIGGDGGFAGLSSAEGMVSHKYFFRDGAFPFERVWPLGEGVPGWVMKNKTSYLTNEAEFDPLVQQTLPLLTKIRSAICVPIVDSNGAILGFLKIHNKKGTKGFTEDDKATLLSLVQSASIAIQNALAFQQRSADLAELAAVSLQLRDLAANQESIREEERTRISRDLHDELGQALTGMKFDLAWLTARLLKKDSTLASRAKQVADKVDLMVKTVRRISTELRPAMLDDLGLVASIEWASKDFEKNTGIACAVTSVDSDQIRETLPLPTALAVYRIFQESLTNVMRHSGARNVNVVMAVNPQEFVIRIQDDGRGIAKQEITGRKTLGLLGMQERAQRLGGSASFFGSSAGTLISVQFPMEKSHVKQ